MIKRLFSTLLCAYAGIAMAQAPANDDLANAVAVNTTQTFNNVAIQNATPSGVTSASCSLGTVSTVWYSHTPTTNGTITGTILNPGPNLDPMAGRFNIVAWYVDGGGTGATLEERLVLAPGNSCVTGNSRTISTVAATTYYAQIDNSLTTATNISFTIGGAAPPNDLITGAIDINATGDTDFTGVNTQNATGGSGGGMVGCNLGSTRKRVYYRFQPTANGTVTTTINNAATSGDILMVWYESALATATADSDLTLADEEGCLTSANPTAVSAVSGRTINVTAGTTYYCVVQHDGGPADISFTVGAPISRPVNDRIETAMIIPNSLPYTTPSIDFTNASGLSYGATQGSNIGSLPRVYYSVTVVTAGTVIATIDSPTNNSDTFIIPFRSTAGNTATDDDQLILASAEGGQFAFGATQTITATAGTTYYFLAQNGTASTVTFSGTATLSLEKEAVTTVTLYPNPAQDLINITASNEFESIAVRNMLGQVVFIKKIAPATLYKLDIDDLKTGNYFVELLGIDGRTHIERFIKE